MGSGSSSPTRRGDVVCGVTPERWTAEFRVLDTVLEPTSAIRTDAVLAVRAGTVGAERA